jgi:hypothetical protein
MAFAEEPYRRRSTALAAVALIVLSWGATPASVRAQDRLTADQWLEDLDSLVAAILTNHPDPFLRVPAARFHATVDSARYRISQSPSDEEAFTWLLRVPAVLDDAHTGWNPGSLPPLIHRWFPLAMYRFADGIFVTGADAAHAEYVGAEVLRIGRMEAEHALRRLLSVLCADNDYRRLGSAVTGLSNATLLYGLGIVDTPDSLPLEVVLPDGRRAALTVASSSGAPPAYVNGVAYWQFFADGPTNHAFTESPEGLPLHLRHLAADYRNYWFTPLDNGRAVYMQFNAVADQEDESFAAFRQRLWELVDAVADTIDAFILDIRYNDGGNGEMNLPFLHEIIQRDAVNRRGSFYTLIGRATNSAALVLMAFLATHTNTTFVGEPAGGSEFLFSNARSAGQLPNSGIELFVASKMLDLRWPAHDGTWRYTFPPEHPAPFSSAEFFAGRDPAVDAIVAGQVRPIEAVLRDDGVDGVADYIDQLTYTWPFHTDEVEHPIDEATINRLGYELLHGDRVDDAIALFELNTRRFPTSANTWDSLGEGYMVKGDRERSIECYERSLELDPENMNARQMLERLRG